MYMLIVLVEMCKCVYYDCVYLPQVNDIVLP